MSQDDAWLWQIFQRLQDAPDMMKAEKMANAMRMTGLNPTEAEVRQVLSRKGGQAELYTWASFSEAMQEALADWSSRDQAQELLSSFQVFDPQGTGLLSQQKILEILRMGGNNFPEEKLQEMLQGVPLNSGAVEYRWLIPYLLGPNAEAPRWSTESLHGENATRWSRERTPSGPRPDAKIRKVQPEKPN
ncbi:Myosin-ID light chain (Calmodulin-like protein mlcD) (Myosin light chain mlcD) (MlcD) [Durusdinium trenchii]|uniref:Calmodulin n=1 Tax=Durusdinium trenchii TaxID=1381693 RepID=A0ABP0J8I6_9DINO